MARLQQENLSMALRALVFTHTPTSLQLLVHLLPKLQPIYMGGNMASTIQSADFFNREEYSDVVVRFGGREIKCHRMILCSKSEYCRKIIGPHAAFKESKEGIVELNEDDPDAVEAMLKHVYTFDYRPTDGRKHHDWQFHLNVAIAADKYDVPVLEHTAVEEVRRIAKATTDIQQVFDIINAATAHPDRRRTLEALTVEMQDRHFAELLRLPALQRMLEGDHKSMWTFLHRVSGSRELLEQQQQEAAICRACGKLSLTKDARMIRGIVCCPHQQCGGAYTPQTKMTTCWVKDSIKE